MLFHQNVTNISLFILQSIKPTVLIGTSGVGRTFTKEVVEAMASFNEVIFATQVVMLRCYITKVVG